MHYGCVNEKKSILGLDLAIGLEFNFDLGLLSPQRDRCDCVQFHTNTNNTQWKSRHHCYRYFPTQQASLLLGLARHQCYRYFPTPTSIFAFRVSVKVRVRAQGFQILEKFLCKNHTRHYENVNKKITNKKILYFVFRLLHATLATAPTPTLNINNIQTCKLGSAGIREINVHC